MNGYERTALEHVAAEGVVFHPGTWGCPEGYRWRGEDGAAAGAVPEWENDLLDRLARQGLIAHPAAAQAVGAHGGSDPGRVGGALRRVPGRVIGEDAMTMEGTRELPISVHHLERLIAHALGDLKKTRRTDNAYAARRAEQRMNALLDQLFTEVIRPRSMR